MSHPIDIYKASRPPLPVPIAAMDIHSRIVNGLRNLLSLDCNSCLDPRFREQYDKVLSLFDQYQREVIFYSGMKRTCGKGCCACCFHWVEDVNSFEAEIITDTVRRFASKRIVHILNTAVEDIRKMEFLDRIVEAKLEETGLGETENIDSTDLLLASYYQFRRTCPLLDNGSCSIYSVRPLTCRIYMSFSDVARCSPDYINTGDIPTYLLDLEEEANSLIDQLHFRYIRYEGDTSLRSLLVSYLTDKPADILLENEKDTSAQPMIRIRKT